MADEEKKTSKAKANKEVAKADKKSDKKADKAKSKKKNPFKAIGSFFKSVKSETKKVIWPDAKTTLKNTATVLVVVVIVGLCIYGVDTLLSLGMKEIKGLSPTTTTSVSTTVDSSATAQSTTAAESTTSAK